MLGKSSVVEVSSHVSVIALCASRICRRLVGVLLGRPAKVKVTRKFRKRPIPLARRLFLALSLGRSFGHILGGGKMKPSGSQFAPQFRDYLGTQ